MCLCECMCVWKGVRERMCVCVRVCMYFVWVTEKPVMTCAHVLLLMAPKWLSVWSSTSPVGKPGGSNVQNKKRLYIWNKHTGRGCAVPPDCKSFTQIYSKKYANICCCGLTGICFKTHIIQNATFFLSGIPDILCTVNAFTSISHNFKSTCLILYWSYHVTKTTLNCQDMDRETWVCSVVPGTRIAVDPLWKGVGFLFWT